MLLSNLDPENLLCRISPTSNCVSKMSYARHVAQRALRQYSVSYGHQYSAGLSGSTTSQGVCVGKLVRHFGSTRPLANAKDLSQLKTFFVFAPDKTTEGSLDRRYQVRAQHLSDVKPHIESGIVRVGGMFTDPAHTPQEGERLKALGSLFLLKAESLEAAHKFIESDIYYTSGVWDPERLLITPFYAATPFP